MYQILPENVPTTRQLLLFQYKIWSQIDKMGVEFIHCTLADKGNNIQAMLVNLESTTIQ